MSGALEFLFMKFYLKVSRRDSSSVSSALLDFKFLTIIDYKRIISLKLSVFEEKLSKILGQNFRSATS